MFSPGRLCNVTTWETELGWMSLAFQHNCVLQLTFGHPTPTAALAAGGLSEPTSGPLPIAIQRLRQQLSRFARGQRCDFAEVEVNTSHLTPLGRQIVTACRAIAWGKVKSYQQLAQEVGRPGAARAVGNVMASNRVPLIIPCHRVIGSTGRLGGYSAPGGLATKQALLAQEGNALFA